MRAFDSRPLDSHQPLLIGVKSLAKENADAEHIPLHCTHTRYIPSRLGKEYIGWGTTHKHIFLSLEPNPCLTHASIGACPDELLHLARNKQRRCIAARPARSLRLVVGGYLPTVARALGNAWA